MALNVKSAAVLAANVLYFHQQLEEDETKPRPPFWSEELDLQAAGLLALLGADLAKHNTPDSWAADIESRLNADASLCQKLERKYLAVTFARLLEVLAKKIITILNAQPPVGEPPEVRIVVERVRGLTSGAPFEVYVVQTLLFFHDRIAAEAAVALEEGLPFPWTLLFELDAVSKSRKLRDVTPQDATTPEDAQLIGLAFSGGGIRSATLNLGLLQSLAELKLFRYFDYLSTVSGGGFIGSWLHAWVKREKDPERVREALSPADSPDPESNANHPIKWLRQYSNYLAPRTGLFSVDSWTIQAVWARNTLLNLVVIVLALAALLMAPRVAMIVFDVVHRNSPLAWIGLAPLAAAIFMIQQNLHSFGEPAARTKRFRFQEKGIHWLVALPIFLSAMLVAAWLAEVRKGGAGLWKTDLAVAITFYVLLSFVSFLGDYRQHFFDSAKAPPGKLWGWTKFTLAVLIFNGFCAALGGLLLFGLEKLFELWKGDGADWHVLVWGPLAVCTLYSLVIILHLGLFGRNLPDDRREWWSRAGAVLSIWVLAWVAVAAMSVYGPWIVTELLHHRVGNYLGTLFGSGWIGTTLMGVLKARGDKTGPQTNDRLSDLIARVAPPVFVIGLLLLVSFGVHMATIALFGFGYAGMDRMEAAHFSFLSWWSPLYALFAAGLCLVLSALLSSRVDVNQFSMHNFYENRLVRCYLGGSHRDRSPNRFTGFDPDDDFVLSKLKPDEPEPYGGPFPIFNTTLNLVSGEELAWQERKAEAFSFTPLFSGFAATPTEERGGPQGASGVTLHAYRPTKDYAFPNGGIRVGRAVAISGAAVSPNMGFHTAPATAFLLTVFNVRLGAWIGNPRDQACWKRSSPGLGLGYLLVELFGAADNKSNYVYLSDGGHFEDLGIYELIRRRCRYIVACDGGQDASFTFDDLGNAIRKCRADFGVEIDIDLNSIRPPAAGSTGTRPLSRTHCAVGSISYPDAPRGTLVYIKASLTGEEPADVLEYATFHPEFPHQTTADQFFDESQFESYRKLGYHMGMVVFGDSAGRSLKKRGAVSEKLDSDRARFFSDLRQRWRASSPNTAESFTRHAQGLVKLMRRLRDDPDLGFLDTQMTPEWERMMSGAVDATHIPPTTALGMPQKASERRAGFHFCNALVQLMEDVYLDLNLETEYDHPDNTGWMNLFNHWSWSAMFRVTWMISASCFGARFRSFCEDRLQLDPVSIGRFEIAAAKIDDDRLNYRERDLLKSPIFDWTQDHLHLLNIIVRRPDPPNADMTKLTVGVAVVSSGNKLAYFRIQEHLRNMGLARRMLDAMIADGMCPIDRHPDWRKGLDQLAEPVRDENQQRIELMMESAFQRQQQLKGGKP